jgi:hypothetical protein
VFVSEVKNREIIMFAQNALACLRRYKETGDKAYLERAIHLLEVACAKS